MERGTQEIPPGPGEIIIKVAGVGGCGVNAVDHMFASGLREVTFIAANTDAQAVAMSWADHAIQLGPKGMAEGGGPEIGRRAAEESFAAVKDAIGEAHLVFIVAGMGGATGTGAAPVIARAAQEAGALLTVGLVTTPLRFEGKKRMERAEAGIAALYQQVDCLITVPNESLYQSAPQPTVVGSIFKMANDALRTAVGCISDILTQHGPRTLDLIDMTQVLRCAGMAVMGTGTASGENRAEVAAKQALACPLLEGASLGEARGVLLNITFGSDLTAEEVKRAYTAIRNEIPEEAFIFTGAVCDESMADEMRVTFIVTIGVDRSPAL